jgi:hydrogenase expression/formation protein HypE
VFRWACILVRNADTLPAGKLPADLLSNVLSRISRDDPRVLVGPRVGTDAAAIDMGSSILIVKSDPITFATADSGWYLVNVNANDIACMGGTPKWLLVTALLPEKSTTQTLVEDLFRSIEDACSAIGVTLVGGHTEITIGLDRPILVGNMLGETTRADLINPADAETGDIILLCKGVAIEGTALLARESPASCLRAVDQSVIDRSAGFLRDPGISVVEAARALQQGGVEIHALHDPTEGGIATALAELVAAAGLGAEVDLDKILIYPETLALCGALDLDPLGLIASGALLALVSASDAERAVQALADANISCTAIGTMTAEQDGLVAFSAGQVVPMPEFEVDEIARFFASVA